MVNDNEKNKHNAVPGASGFAREVNFEGLPGPTHLFSGLSKGNIASTSHGGKVSQPRAAALQCLEKIKFLSSLGSTEAIILPQVRPDLSYLKAKGFTGSDLEILKAAYDKDPGLLKIVFSSAFMWTANAAMVSPSSDCSDNKCHLTVANLAANPHRAIEAKFTYDYLSKNLANENIIIDPALGSELMDEGAANHTRFSLDYSSPGIELFVYGYSKNDQSIERPVKFPARQSLESCEKIISSHKLSKERVVLAHQNPKVIDAGVFHNDVISTGNLNYFIYHQESFTSSESVINELNEKFKTLTDENMIFTEVKTLELSLEDAVGSYLFNSQIVSPKDPKHMILIAPIECEENPRVKTYIEKLISDENNPLKEVKFFNLKESMKNGGGPACLRLRVILSEEELKGANSKIFYSEELHNNLKNIINKYYPKSLTMTDLLNQEMLDNLNECYEAFNEILKVPSLLD
ncbi:MAG: N-succinylarginine dihydrolase [Candidatus Caenarcaniphilales bacterium]|nr:N-succinylarginine dihydrolase [Candidatus Caenarcaniphilales bacterium]